MPIDRTADEKTLPRAQTSSIFASTIMRGSSKAKRLFLLRHGQAVHNPRAEAARSAGCSHEEFLELMRQDDAFDAPLTELGEAQAQAARDRHGPRLRDVELVVSSPLTRALRTADLALPPPPPQPLPREPGTHKSCGGVGVGEAIRPKRVCVEHFREINGWLVNAKRRDKTDLSSKRPWWDFSDLPSHKDEAWTEELEAFSDCGERGYRGLLWVAQRTEERVLVVSHGGLLRFCLNDHPNVRLVDGRSDREPNGGADQRCVRERFGNCELREYVMHLEYDDDDGDEAPSAEGREGQPLVNGVKNCQKRPIITLTEVTGEEDQEDDETRQGVEIS